MAARVESRLEIERLLHFALPNAEISLDYQPQLDRTGRIVGVEALARWNNATLGAVAPAHFIPVAEQTGLIVELGKYILERAFITLREWHEAGIELEQFSINISMRQFTHHDFEELVRELVQRHLDADLRSRVMFEITESIVAEDINRVIAIMQRLTASLGIRFSMDDFGTGYSSLSYLTRLPLDELKIDRAFICTLGRQEEGPAMVATILNMADVLKLKIVAEGVETAQQHDFLMRHGCTVFQGYYHSEPLAKERFVEYFRSRN
jgi:EAL domain-containing protein (putative c-di-GMP-specific phosphodiesterase class I)